MCVAPSTLASASSAASRTSTSWSSPRSSAAAAWLADSEWVRRNNISVLLAARREAEASEREVKRQARVDGLGVKAGGAQRVGGFGRRVEQLIGRAARARASPLPVDDEHEPARREQSAHLGERRLAADLVQQVDREDPVAAAVGKGDAVLADLQRACALEAGQPLGEAREHLGTLVDGDDLPAVIERLGHRPREASGAGAVVDDGLAAAQCQQRDEFGRWEVALALGR